MKVGHFPFTLFHKEMVLLFWAPEQEVYYFLLYVLSNSNCDVLHISNDTQLLRCQKCIQAHILFLLLVFDGDFQPESKEKKSQT